MIGAEGDQLGIMTSAAALALAEEKDLDLVKIAPNAVPPVCKIMDYGKFRFEQLKKEKEAKKNQKVVEVNGGDDWVVPTLEYNGKWRPGKVFNAAELEADLRAWGIIPAK